MDNSRLMRRRERRGDLNGDIKRGYRRHPSVSQNLPQSHSLYEFSGDEMGRIEIADLIDGDDVGVVERAGGSGLLLEPEQTLIVFGALFEQQLERDLSFEPRVEGQIDLPHPAGAERRNDLIAVESCSCDNGHFGKSSWDKRDRPNTSVTSSLFPYFRRKEPRIFTDAAQGLRRIIADDPPQSLRRIRENPQFPQLLSDLVRLGSENKYRNLRPVSGRPTLEIRDRRAVPRNQFRRVRERR